MLARLRGPCGNARRPAASRLATVLWPASRPTCALLDLDAAAVARVLVVGVRADFADAAA